MAFCPLPPVEFLGECFSYDADSGKFHWRPRPSSHFSREADMRSWNTLLAGTEAFTFVTDDGYYRCEIRYLGRRIRLRAHRVALKLLTGEEPDIVDHKNGNGLDNRAANLRAATHEQSSWNKAGYKASTLPKCVSHERGKYRAYAQVKGKKVHLGAFSSAEIAHAAWKAFAEPLHGDFFNPGRFADTRRA
jgi:hypothetical protein